MFALKDKDGKFAAMRDGKRFEYSTRDLAKLGKRVLETDRKVELHIVSV